MSRIVEGMTYPLLDPTRYDDEHGTGYAFATTAAHVGPGEWWTADMWLVDAQGNVHPGYDRDAIPIMAEDLDIQAGFATTARLPDMEH